MHINGLASKGKFSTEPLLTLQEFKSLKKLFLPTEAVTEEGVSRLRKDRPDVDVI